MDLIDIGRYLGALLLVLGLIGAAGLAARRFSLPGIAMGFAKPQAPQQGPQRLTLKGFAAGLMKPSAPRRLAVVESLMITPRQRLLIVRRDDVEHLVLLTGDGATVLEAAIAPPKETQP